MQTRIDKQAKIKPYQIWGKVEKIFQKWKKRAAIHISIAVNAMQ